MNEHKVKIISSELVTYDVRAIKFEKPKEFSFVPGQASDVSVNKPSYVDQKRPFTFTGLNKWDHLEFIIKIYNDHNGVTKEIGELNTGDELIISEPWGDIRYEGEGVFLAGGAGITPFIAILRELKSENKVGNNKLIFANKMAEDIILADELEEILGKNLINILSREKVDKYASGFIDEKFLKDHLKDDIDGFNEKFYLCGPPPMMDAVEKLLKKLDVDESSIIKEGF